jgi:S1-C subfamily serine protease
MTGVVLAGITAMFIHTATLTDWSAIIRPAAKQVPRLEILKDGTEKPGICSGAIINKDQGYVVTAAHCLEGDPKTLSVTVNGRHAEIIKSNRLLDLAVVKANLRGGEEMTLAPETPEVGTEAAVLGFAFGIEKMAVQFGRVSQARNDESKLLWLNLDLIFGDSGGPAIDTLGRLIGINSRIYYNGPAHMAGIVPVEVVREFAENYLPKK